MRRLSIIFPAAIIILLSWSLRIYGLDRQSLALDEGWTSYFIHLPWSQMFPALTPDNHPPLYYVGVKAWAEIAGYGDFSLRLFSVFCGVTLIAALYALGRRLGGPSTGLAAAIWGACSPTLIYYAQEARMYSLLMLLGVLSSYSLARWFDEPERWRWSAGYALAAAGALYTQYFALLLLAAQNIIFAGQWAWRRIVRQQTGSAVNCWNWAGSQAAMAMLYLPWLPTLLHQIRVGQGTWWRVPLPPRFILDDIWLFFILGPHRLEQATPLSPLTWGVLLAATATLLLGWRQGIGRWLSLWVALALPVGAMVWLGSRLPVYTDRYTLIATPGLALCIGWGVSACWHAQIRRWLWLGPTAAALTLLAATVGPLPQLNAYYHQPRYWREDFRRAAQYVMDTTSAGDAIILLGCYPPIMQYYRGEATIVRLPQQGDSVQDQEQAVALLNQAITPSSRVRLVMHSWPTVDPQGLIEGMLRDRCHLEGEHWQRETGQRPIKILNFAACTPLMVEPRTPLDAVWNNEIAMSAYRQIHFEPGRQAHLFLWWRALRRPDKNYSAFVHLVGSDGQMITQFDHVPLNDFYPMRAWPLQTDQRDDYPLNIPPGANLEGAWLAVGLYDAQTMQRLPVSQNGQPAGDAIHIPVRGKQTNGTD